MNHYCTYFDSGFLRQGRVLWASLKAHDPEAVLWILALDAEAVVAVAAWSDPQVKVFPLAAVEDGDAELASARANRSRIEYYFTLSPCWPRWLLAREPAIERLLYLDADLMFFSSPAPIWQELAQGSILVCAHRFPSDLRHFERHGRYNVGVLGWKRDAEGLACLEDWRRRCLEWCYDRIEPGRYADQGYLNEWDKRHRGVIACKHPGVNVGPWNWRTHRIGIAADGAGGISIDDRPLVVFHFAALRFLGGARWDSGQLDYGVMPRGLRGAIYGPYLEALLSAGDSAATRPARRRLRLRRWLPALVFGSVWRRGADGSLPSVGWEKLGPRSGSWLARWRREARES